MKTSGNMLFSGDSLHGEFASSLSGERDWRVRLGVSRRMGLGFAAPGGEYSRSLFEFVAGGLECDFKSMLRGERVVELGAGMMPYGYALAATCGARNYLGVEPFYADVLQKSVNDFIRSRAETVPRIPFKIVANHMLYQLQEEGDDLVSIVACGIENCILPNEGYKKKVEAEIFRVLRPGGVFLSSHSDLDPKGLRVNEQWFRRLSTSSVQDRIRIYRKD